VPCIIGQKLSKWIPRAVVTVVLITEIAKVFALSGFMFQVTLNILLLKLISECALVVALVVLVIMEIIEVQMWERS
jgi:hypothetical protein